MDLRPTSRQEVFPWTTGYPDEPQGQDRSVLASSAVLPRRPPARCLLRSQGEASRRTDGQGAVRREVSGAPRGVGRPGYIPSRYTLGGAQYCAPPPCTPPWVHPALHHAAHVRAVEHRAVHGALCRAPGLCSSCPRWAVGKRTVCCPFPVMFGQSCQLSFRAQLTTIGRRSDAGRATSRQAGLAASVARSVINVRTMPGFPRIPAFPRATRIFLKILENLQKCTAGQV